MSEPHWTSTHTAIALALLTLVVFSAIVLTVYVVAGKEAAEGALGVVFSACVFLFVLVGG